MTARWIKPFVGSAGGILLAAALIRLFIAFGDAPGLNLHDPLLGLPLRSAVLLVGGLELIVALICLWGRRVSFQLDCLAGLVAVYMVVVFCMRCHVQGTGMGSLTDPLQIGRGTIGLILRFVPLYLLAGSLLAAFAMGLEESPETIWPRLKSWRVAGVDGLRLGIQYMRQQWVRLFMGSVGVLLLAAALIRFGLAADVTQTLNLPDPLLGFPLRYELLAVGLIELVVAFVFLFGRRTGLQLGLLGWLVVNFAAYRVGLLWLQSQPQCAVLGPLTDPFHLAPGLTRFHVDYVLPAYVLLGVMAVLLLPHWGSRVARLFPEKLRNLGYRAGDFLKMSCPACGGHVKFPSVNLGRKIPCPHCRKNLTLRRPENLKMSCFFCHEHIEFPAHALGQKLPCPHCNMGITLMEPA